MMYLGRYLIIKKVPVFSIQPCFEDKSVVPTRGLYSAHSTSQAPSTSIRLPTGIFKK